jgi:hypothetical protein
MLKFLSSFALFVPLLLALNLNAQNVIWGVGSTNVNSDTIGRFSKPFGSGANAWTAVSVFHGNVTGCTQVLPGNAFWTRSTTGRSIGNFFGNRPAMTSPTVADGVGLFDSDYLDNNGTATFNSGTAPTGYNCGGTVPGHRGELHSPTFDLSGYTDSTVSAAFYLYYRPFTIRELSIGFSTDNGGTWTDFDITQGVAANAEFLTARIEIPLFGVLDGATNLTQCKIRFTFDGYYYFAMVDDLSLTITPDYDFAISGQTAGNTLGDGFTTTYTSDYRFSPITQQDLSNYFYTARVTNFGAKDILPANNARINYILEKQVGTGWSSIFTGSIPVDTVRSEELITPDQANFPNLNMIDTFGNYRATLIAVHNLPDGKTSNDTLRHTFSITEKYFSRCRLNTTDNQVFANRPIFPGASAGNVVTEFEHGSMFYFPGGARDSVRLDSVNFRVYAPNSLVSGFTAAPITVRVYEFRDVDGDGTLNTSATTNELSLVGIGLDTVPLTAGQYRARTVSVIDLNTFSTLYLKDTSVYFVTLDQRNAQGLAVGTAYRCAWYGADELNYSINAAILADMKPRHPAPARIAQANSTTFVSATNDWNWIGFGADLTPSIRLVLGGNLNPFDTTIVNPVATGDFEDIEATMELYPNPATEELNLRLSFGQETSIATYIFTNINGQVLDVVNRKNLKEEIYSYDISRLPAGVYFVTVKTDKGLRTQRFIKQ